ncbi:MAG: Rpn family recombination-promoting nuclease/putative transposase [Spirochaetota bacterium]
MLENQSTPDKTILLRSFLYILSLYDTLWRQSSNGLLPNVLPVILYNGQDDWYLPSNLRGLIESRLPERWIPSFECFVIVEKDVPKKTLNRLHNLVAAVILLERQQDEEGLSRTIMQVIEFVKSEKISVIQDLLVWMGKLFKDGPEPESVQQLRDLGGVRTMLSELAKKVNRNAELAAKAEKAHLEGVLEGELRTAKALLRKGIALETVLSCTGLTEDQLAREMKKNSGV